MAAHPHRVTRLAAVAAVAALSSCGAATLLVHAAAPTETVTAPAAAVGTYGRSGGVDGGPGTGRGGWHHHGPTGGAAAGGKASRGAGPAGGPGGPASVASRVRPATRATAAETVGVVDVLTTLDRGRADAAGTGIVLTSSGRVLTNDHVIVGATSVAVRDLTTGRWYRAAVVGGSPTADVAVLQVEHARGLATAALGDSATVTVGQAVTGVGNAGNAPGTAAAVGTVTALGQAITAHDVGAPRAERITGLIETSADVQPGDSGGPLLDASGLVVGMATAAATDRRTGATEAGYAIPIDHAIAVVDRIVGAG